MFLHLQFSVLVTVFYFLSNVEPSLVAFLLTIDCMWKTILNAINNDEKGCNDYYQDQVYLEEDRGFVVIKKLD